MALFHVILTDVDLLLPLIHYCVLAHNGGLLLQQSAEAHDQSFKLTIFVY